jgi:quinol monooxygenase YgiN
MFIHHNNVKKGASYMSSLLAKIQIHPGRESDFEELMAYMYSQTHETEEGVLRYEYWRGREPGFYYCLLSFRDAATFWRHQASDHHEGQMQRFTECIAALDLEIIDPVQGASPLPPTLDAAAPADASPAEQEQAQRFPVATAQWWKALRG